jgi:hypothetical protein
MADATIKATATTTSHLDPFRKRMNQDEAPWRIYRVL